jgi:hypothetical protein
VIRRSPLYGAVVGRSYLRVVEGYLDGDDNAPSRLEVYTPEIVTTLRDQHNHNNLIAAKIEYLYYEEQSMTDIQARGSRLGGPANWLTAYMENDANRALGAPPLSAAHTYTMIITEDAYRTFRDGEPYRFGSLGNSWRNRMGIVPIIDVPFEDIGEEEGLPTFHNIIDTLDALNGLLTMFGQIVKMHADPMLLAYGIKPPDATDPTSQWTKSLTGDGTTVYHIPMPASFGINVTQAPPRLEYLEWRAGNAGSLLEFLRMISQDCERMVPEMKLYQAAQRSGSGYEASVDNQPVVDKIEEIRDVQFDAAEDALQLALVADDVAGDTLSRSRSARR